MGRINTIIQRHVDERIEQKQALLTERVEKLEKAVLELKCRIVFGLTFTYIITRWHFYKLISPCLSSLRFFSRNL